jgi:tetratricopeptide (TPR) repeat protein
LLSVIAWLVVPITAWIYRKKFPVFAWAVAWFLIAHLIESTIIPLEIIFEHRMYLPSIGLSFLTMVLLFDFFYNKVKRPLLLKIILIMFFVILGGATFTRNIDFRDEISLYAAEYQKFPNSNRNRLGLALALNRAGRVAEGGRMLREMAHEEPYDFVIQQNWYNFLVKTRIDNGNAEDLYQHIVSLIENGHYCAHQDAVALKNLAELFFEKRNYERALFLLDRLLVDYRRDSFFLLKGICHAKQNEWYLSMQACHEAMKLRPNDMNILYWYGKSLFNSGKVNEGCKLLNKGIKEGNGDEKVLLLCQKLLNEHCGVD